MSVTARLISPPVDLPYLVGPKVFNALINPIFVLVCSIEPWSYRSWFLTYTAKYKDIQGSCNRPSPCQC